MSQPLDDTSRQVKFTLPVKSHQHPAEPDAADLWPPDAIDAQSIDAIYLHIPFCFHKCHYCDFYSIVDDRDRQEAFTRRLIAEIDAWQARAGTIKPTSIFVGGGTPTLLRPELWAELLAALHKGFDVTGVREFTVEANPETVTAPLLGILADGGINRLSIGAQSFDPVHLKTLERWHDPTSVRRAVELARAAGIDNFNLDLIYAIPGQSLSALHADLDAALALGPTHLSCYALTYEPNTALTTRRDLGRITPMEDEMEATMFEAVVDRLSAAGFEQYEISNFARPDRRCRHNLAYWQNASWLALGPSASGHLNGLRWKNIPHLRRYLDSTALPPVIDLERLNTDARVGEQLMLGLRLIDGVRREWVERNVTGPRRRELDQHLDTGLLETTATHLRLTRRGLLVADAITASLL